MVGKDPGPDVRDGRAWCIGTDADVAWIVGGTSIGLTITAGIPPVFDAYATIVLPDNDIARREHDRAVLGLLGQESGRQPWWLGYLDTGLADIVFPDVPMVTLYANWHYMLVEAGREQASTWRDELPDLMFPTDHSWLLSTLWDDDWTCMGGSAGLVARFLSHPGLDVRQVELGRDATPPGHQAF
jgi:hypothetical protein